MLPVSQDIGFFVRSITTRRTSRSTCEWRGQQETSLMRQTGTVKFFNATKGFGFLTPDEGDKDVFVHISAVEQSGLSSLDEGMKVSFETEPDPRGKGPKAVNLEISG